jgi:hypothetical protein
LKPAEVFAADENPMERKQRIHEELTRQRDLIRDRLLMEGAVDLATKLETCGQSTNIVCTSCGDYHPIETRCNRRWCPVCARKLAARRVAKYDRRLQRLQWPLWVTLTIKNRDDEAVVEDLKKAWKKFRRKQIFTAHTVGGLWALEVTERGNGWHPHIHAMLDCKWLAAVTPAPHPNDNAAQVREKIDYAKAELAAEWGESCGQPFAIALAVRKSASAASRELLKYAVKGSDLLECLLPIAPIIRQIDSGRTISTFGTLREGKLPPEPDDDRPALACTNCGAEKSWIPADVAAKFYGSGSHGRTVRPSQS